jgi:hypothetical protein
MCCATGALRPASPVLTPPSRACAVVARVLGVGLAAQRADHGPDRRCGDGNRCTVGGDMAISRAFTLKVRP